MAGGVALNCVLNGKILKEKIFKKIWIQPASGDAGCSLGAAMAAWHLHHKKERFIPADFDSMKGTYLGPSFTNKEIESDLKSCKANFKKFKDEHLIEEVSNALKDGKAVGWMQGRMEFGPRALGSRSIIAVPAHHLCKNSLI